MIHLNESGASELVVHDISTSSAMMNSDDYFPDDLDSGILNQLDVIEAAHCPKLTHNPPTRHAPKSFSAPKPVPPSKPAPPKRIEKEDSYMDLTLDIDEADLQRLDSFIDAAYKGRADPVAGPSNAGRPPSKGSVQTTLFGDIVHPPTSTSKASPISRGPTQRSKSDHRNPFGQQAPQTKQWDHTEFAKSGLKKSKSKGKSNEDEQAEEVVEFEQFPAPFVSVLKLTSTCAYFGHELKPSECSLPMKLKVDKLEAKHWIYPLNQPKRDYQFNIVKHCLFDNTLVSLPTGLGKTFIAGVVMLNFYRWFPEGKVVFVAPTKPLVAQQIDACHRTCGIPGRDAVELTGNNPRAYRSRMWEEKRVFYMTPQTLINDLTTENCDPRDIILVVIDEAHKGTGDYAYAQVIRYLMTKNPYFRVLALTATPGSTPETVQAIVDSLHISRIEIRDEGSLDLREYMHKKEVKQHIIKMTDDIAHFQQLLKTVMESVIKPLVARGVMEPLDVVKMHPYRTTAIMQRIAAQRNSPHLWAMGTLSMVSSMARAMSYLMEASVSMCLHSLQDLVRDKEGSDQKKKRASKLNSDSTFQKLLADLEAGQKRPGGLGMHPKMETLKTLLVQHFGQKIPDGDEEDAGMNGTRAMVFVTYRECVDEIVEVLNQESPLLKATRFVGQGIDKQGKKGFAQKEQLEVIRKFKAGEFNVMVSTSIGEEGLDIGEVDMIICYDAQKTPIRMLQRVGRTGRKRDGYVHVLLAEIREELNWDKAHDTYGELQRCIVRGDQLELFGDVPRLLPDQMRPQVLEKRMEIEEYVREQSGRKKATVTAEDEETTVSGKKRKRNDDIDRNIPPGATRGFVSVANLLVKGKKKKKIKLKEFDDTLADDDSTDMELEGNILDIRRTVSTPAPVVAASGSTHKNMLPKSRTMVPRKRKPSAANKRDPLTLSHPSRQVDVNMEMDQDMSYLDQSTSSKEVGPNQSPQLICNDVIEIMSSSPSRSTSPRQNFAPAESAGSSKHKGKERAFDRGSIPPSLNSSPEKANDQDIAWLLDEDEDPDIQIVSSPPAITKMKHSTPRSLRFMDASVLEVDDSVVEVIEVKTIPPPQTGPPATPPRVTRPSPGPTPDIPEGSFAVRPAGRRRIVRTETSEIPDIQSPPPLRRLRRNDTETISRASTPPLQPKKFGRRPPISIRHHPWLDGEAAHSGDEESAGSSHSEDDVESDSDRQFVKDTADTQVSPSYDQTLAYRQSLFTQAGLVNAPVFANRPGRVGAFVSTREHSRRRPMVSSSPPREDLEPDEYAFGSFVVEDDADLSFD
ncbi:P-loop containing nucleoside triphosphate hydrolase protein [Butyriboletus roseoflavus]|nr:P-loop containing nucleoside triphosphate hydrolase protein [Butyriboletus roseoflavus]